MRAWAICMVGLLSVAPILGFSSIKKSAKKGVKAAKKGANKISGTAVRLAQSTLPVASSIGAKVRPSKSVTNSPRVPMDLSDETIENETRILQTFAPEVRFSSGDQYFCSSAGYFADKSSLNKWIIKNQTSELVLSRDVLMLNDLSKPEYQGEDLFLDPPKTKDFRRGSLPQQGILTCPTYSQLVRVGEKKDKAVLQYAFFYPWNEPTDALKAVGKKHALGRKFVKGVTSAGTFGQKTVDIGALHVGTHEGDWEQTSVHIATDPSGQLFVERILMSRHRYRDWGYDDVRFTEGAHPVIYISKGGHANYGYPVTVPNRLTDVADGKGPRWKTWINLVNMGSFKQPTPGNGWIGYAGSWGKLSGPRMGAGTNWWLKESWYPSLGAVNKAGGGFPPAPAP